MGEELKEYTLMMKNYAVADLLISEESGEIEKIIAVHHPSRLPLGTLNSQNQPVRGLLNRWWVGRSIPTSRHGVEKLFSHLGLPSPTLLLSKSYGLSLSDQYWVCPKNSHLKWSAINFFTNDFSSDIGELLFGRQLSKATPLNLTSPDNTSDGVLKKKWIISQEKRYLMKAGSGVFKQQPFNEVVATILLKALRVNHAPYSLTFENGEFYSLCETFINQDTELITAFRISQVLKQRNHETDYEHFKHCCRHLSIPSPEKGLEQMIVLDYLIANTDRHWNNFGFIRQVDTLEWLGMAPIFDSGHSLWNESAKISDVDNEESKTFLKTNREQLGLITDLTWFSKEKAVGALPEIRATLNKNPNLSPLRIDQIIDAIKERIELVAKIQKSIVRDNA